MADRKVAWKNRKDNEYIGKEIPRIDGAEKASGNAKYANDINTKGTLYAKLLTCKNAHAKIKLLDVEPAMKVAGVKAVHKFKDVGTVCRWDGELVVAVAAERPEQAEDGVRAIRVEYEVLDHVVDEADLKGAQEAEKKALDALKSTFPAEVRALLEKKEDDLTKEQKDSLKPFNDKLDAVRRTKQLGENVKGDVAAALKTAKHVHKGYYGIATISHMCLEPHGSHAEWVGDDSLKVHLSTQNVNGTGGQFAAPAGIPQANVEVVCNYIGGGFGSKFSAGEWGIAATKLAKDTGRPVRLMLDRATELKTPGTRPSGFGNVTIAADETGRIVAWDSDHWGTGGIGGGTIALNQMPYVFDFENRVRKATGISTNCGPNQAWRAPPHPQLCALTCTALDDLAAKVGMDSLEFFRKNIDQVGNGRQEVYLGEFAVAAKLIDWKAKWHPHGKGAGTGPVKKGLGLAIHQWGGAAHAAKCNLKVHPDGTVETFSASQDLGTGTRTCIAITLAETFGIPLSMVKVNIGTNKYPPAGGSGGSTTIGGVTGPNRRAGLEALWKIFDLVAEKYKVAADTLVAKGGNILSGDKTVCTWKEAARLVGPTALEVQGEGPKADGLTDQGVAGVQMVEVSVDSETGKVRIDKFVAVQDCGLIIDLMTAKSQVYGALIMGISYALTEERIMDNKTGRYINADLENYKLPRIGDIGELIVEMYQPDSQYDRGVVGLGEPPVIAPGAAISNAVANALGVRIPVIPITPKRVLDTLKKA